MSISDNYSPTISNGNGATTVFTGNWSPLSASYMRVYLRLISTGVDTLQVRGTDYSLSFTSSGFAVTFVTAPSALYRVVCSREVAIEQTDPYSTASGFQGLNIESSFDKLTAISQDMQDDVDRCLKFLTATSYDTELPTPVANNLLGWNSGADGLENKVITDTSTTVISAFMGDLLESSDAAEAQTNIGISAYAQTILDDTTAAAARTTLDAEQKANSLNAVAVAANDYVIISDTSDSNSSKKALASSFVFYSAVAGFVPSSIAGTSTTASLTISAGQATDSTNSKCLTGSTFSWAVSNGNAANGYEGGTTLPNSSTIHFYVIALATDTTWTASFASTSVTPTLPGSYTLYRRVFSILTDGSGNLLACAFSEVMGGAILALKGTTALDVSVSNLGATAVLYALAIPSGIKVQPLFRAIGSTVSSDILITSPYSPDEAVSSGAAPLVDTRATSDGLFSSQFTLSNTSAQIRARAGDAGTSLRLSVYGWIDFRR